MESYHNILLAVDFSEASKQAATRAVELAKHYQAALCLCHVVEHFPVDIPVDVIPPEGGDKEQYVKEQALRKLQDYCDQLGYADAKLVALISEGSAKSEIARLAEQQETDLIVLGTHGHRKFAGLLGSTASGLINLSPCDVLAVHAKAA